MNEWGTISTIYIYVMSGSSVCVCVCTAAIDWARGHVTYTQCGRADLWVCVVFCILHFAIGCLETENEMKIKAD